MLRKALFIVVLLLGLNGLEANFNPAIAATDSVVTVPILLYHSIPGSNSTNDRYAVSVEKFEEQMKQLRDWGYTTITIQELVGHVRKGSVLPRRPIVITFDDGYQNVFENAFPIMERYGFSGTVYIVANRLESDGFMGKKELKELIENGWEVGSHGMTHTELTQNHALVRSEILQSRLDLNKALGIKVFSFAYPFGSLDWYISNKVLDYGYFAAVGVGNLSAHSAGTVYNLSRREVEGDSTLDEFIEFLPWTGRYIPPFRKYTPL